MVTKPKKEDEDFLTFLQVQIRGVLDGSDASPAERIKAIEMGTKLELARHKIKGGSEGGFFDE
jgi:hypothetical protein